MATNTNLSLSGLASGFDWQSLVSQLIQVERAPETRMRSQQATLQQKNSAYGTISTQLQALNDSVNALKDPNFFNSRLTSLSDPTIATATADATAGLGTYTFNITQLAAAATQMGVADGGKALSATSNVAGVVLGTAGFATGITAGSFAVNGKIINIAATDTLQSVFDQINSATGGVVSGAYDPTTDTISLASNDQSQIVLGSATDTSNFLQATKLYNNGTDTVASASALGGVKLGNAIASSNLATAITDGGSGAGAFTINGVQINFNASSDSINDILSRINNSAAGVTASYDTVNDRFQLANKSTGDVGISLQDNTGNFLAATGLSGGTLQRGANLLYTINGGGTLTSQSSTITQVSSGITGLSVTALQKGTTTVTIGSDTAKIQSTITSFVNNYNATQRYIDSQTASTTDAQGKVTAGLLTGDLDANDIETTLRQLSTATPDGASGLAQNFNSLGIISNGSDNTLSLSDTTKLSNALSSNLNDIKNLFTDPNSGLMTKLSAYLTAATSDSGILSTKQADYTKQSGDIDTNIADMERRITAEQDRMTSEFVAMETAQATLNQQAQYLTQTFGGSSSTSGKA